MNESSQSHETPGTTAPTETRRASMPCRAGYTLKSGQCVVEANEASKGVVFQKGNFTYWAPDYGTQATKYFDGHGWKEIASSSHRWLLIGERPSQNPNGGVPFYMNNFLYWAPAAGAYATHVWTYAGWRPLN